MAVVESMNDYESIKTTEERWGRKRVINVRGRDVNRQSSLESMMTESMTGTSETLSQ